MHSHRSWFPVILTGLSVALAVIIFAVYDPSEAPHRPSSTRPENSQITPAESAPTDDQYQAAVNAVMDSLESSGDAAAAYSALVAVRVPADYLDFHLQLVYLLNDAKAGESVNDRWEALVDQYPWLHLPIRKTM